MGWSRRVTEGLRLPMGLRVCPKGPRRCVGTEGGIEVSTSKGTKRKASAPCSVTSTSAEQLFCTPSYWLLLTLRCGLPSFFALAYLCECARHSVI